MRSVVATAPASKSYRPCRPLQILHSTRRGSRNIEHLGRAHDEAELEALSALYYVRLFGDVDPVVQVFAIAVKDLDPSAGLYERLNDINANICCARTFWVSGQVLFESDLAGRTISPDSFERACQAVATITDHFGALLAEEFGGSTPFQDDKQEDTPFEDSAKLG